MLSIRGHQRPWRPLPALLGILLPDGAGKPEDSPPHTQTPAAMLTEEMDPAHWLLLPRCLQTEPPGHLLGLLEGGEQLTAGV